MSRTQMNLSKARASGASGKQRSATGAISMDLSACQNKTDMIRKIAQELYLKKGCKPGHDLDNWLEAEKLVNSGKV